MKKLLLFIFMCVSIISIDAKAEEIKPTAYYFYGDARCYSCKKIEQYLTEVYNENFKDKFELKLVNVDKEENKHFTNEYKIYTKSIVLETNPDDNIENYKNLDKVWTLLRNEEKFKEYLREEMRAF